MAVGGMRVESVGMVDIQRCGSVYLYPSGSKAQCVYMLGHDGKHRSSLEGSYVEWEDQTIDHPPHYGGAADPYEAIKVIEAWDLGFCLGNTVKYIRRAGKKRSTLDVSTFSEPNKFVQGSPIRMLEDLKKARWYLDREIQRLEEKK